MPAKPRRCSTRWLDADCPREVLAILDDPRTVDRFTIIYADTYAADDPRGPWLGYLCSTEEGSVYHGEFTASDCAAYRYREKRHYAKWSTLPDAVKAAVLRDIAASKVA